jgi:uncharacterized protein YjiS (DUF1127 family)
MLRTLWKWLLETHKAHIRARTRRELHELSDRMLKDIGLTRRDVDRLF